MLGEVEVGCKAAPRVLGICTTRDSSSNAKLCYGSGYVFEVGKCVSERRAPFKIFEAGPRDFERSNFCFSSSFDYLNRNRMKKLYNLYLFILFYFS